jgi:alpha-L-rhamnosidase
VHFAGLIGKLVADQRAVGATALAYTHIDSWETGSQNWTPGFREEFRARRGYDLVPYLPISTGRAVASAEVSERFLWDLRRTIADMLLVNYAGHFRDLSHQNGLKLSIEAYGNGPLDDLPYAGLADLPVSEFWMGMEPWWVTKEMASAAHTYGKPVLAAEAFTSRAWNGKWQNHPFRFKPLGDQMFTLGINRFVIHRYAMQPWLNRWPGMTMGPYGIHFERTITWWEQSKAWLAYLARCQHVLQQGRFVADVAYIASERAPNDAHAPLTNIETPPGYDYDVVSAELLSRMSVRDGRVTLPSGMSYRVLVSPAAASMRVAQLRDIRKLVAAGATLLGSPPSKSPSLAEYGAGDAEVRRIAAELWADCDGVNITEHRYGKGRVVWGKPLATLLSDEGAPPDFGGVGFEPGKQLRYIHRAVGDQDIYFLASSEPEAATFLATFRVTGKRPALWWPDSGRIQPLAVYDEQPAQTRIPIRLAPYGSVFVVFTSESAPERLTALTRDGVEATGMLATSATDLRGKSDGISVERDGDAYRLEVARLGSYELRTASGRQMRVEIPSVPEPIEIAGPWQLEFPKGWGAPERVALDRLISWTSHPDDGVKHFSGTATYRRAIAIPAAMLGSGRGLYLDLGRVEVIAEVRLNGRDLGILWKPPFRVDITEAARTGENDLEVRVVSLWPNRLIGDDRLPPDAEWNGPRIKDWPQWHLDGKSSPTGRFTFSPRKHWSKDDPLLDSGLLGPVRVEATAKVRVVR